MIRALRARAFRALVEMYLAFEVRVASKWHPDYQRAFARGMSAVKRRLFVGQGSNSLSNWLDSDGAQNAVLATPTSGGSSQGELDPLAQRLALVAQPPSEVATWLWLEQENLRLIARREGLAAFDWNHLKLVRQKTADGIDQRVRDLLTQHRSAAVANVLILPWLKHGGADKAAIAYLEVLARRLPGRVVAITTEPGESPWLRRVPAGVEVIEWAKLRAWPDATAALCNLGWFLCHLRPEVIHVMNSWLGWELLARQGRRLRAISRVFASLFWYGPSEHGRLRGYASEYLPRVIDKLDGVLTDNATFPVLLQHDYGYSAAPFHCVWHPTGYIVDQLLDKGDDREHLTVLWASRFAPEKKMDVLAAVAVARPQHRFLVFGVGDGPLSGLEQLLETLRGLPNVELRGEYDGFESLPVEACDVFLYTSSSDGMPNVVIEAAAHGLPVIAPKVGGIAELIDADTGWLIPDFDRVDQYLQALDEAASPTVRVQRAAAALERVRARHSFAAFERHLCDVPGYVTGNQDGAAT